VLAVSVIAARWYSTCDHTWTGHASITTTLDLYGHLYPGEMDRCADHLNEAAGMSDGADDAAKMRPDDGGDEGDPTESGS
jgi:hypothetical protein